jgi:hypothetical protein
VKGDSHASFCGSPGVKFPRATRRVAARRPLTTILDEDSMASIGRIAWTEGRMLFADSVATNPAR